MVSVGRQRPGEARDRKSGGRPSKAEAGEVDARVLDAAAAVFMDQGYEGTTFEQIAAAARAGKATIYARYASKEALFEAVIRRTIDRSMALDAEPMPDLPPAERLARTLCDLVDRMLSVDAIALTRVVVAEASRFPPLARLVDEVGRQRAAEIVAAVLDDPSSGLGASGSRPEAVGSAAAMLLELTFVPLMLRALMGEPRDLLRTEIGGRVSRAIATVRAVNPGSGHPKQ